MLKEEEEEEKGEEVNHWNTNSAATLQQWLLQAVTVSARNCSSHQAQDWNTDPEQVFMMPVPLADKVVLRFLLVKAFPNLTPSFDSGFQPLVFPLWHFE